jgi:hypothetical protein
VRQPAPAVAMILISAAALAAVAIIYFRWLNGSHFRLYPLVFPLVCAGLVWNGEWMPGVIGLLGSTAGFAAPLLFAPNVTSKGTHQALVKRLGPLSVDPPLP